MHNFYGLDGHINEVNPTVKLKKLYQGQYIGIELIERGNDPMCYQINQPWVVRFFEYYSTRSQIGVLKSSSILLNFSRMMGEIGCLGCLD